MAGPDDDRGHIDAPWRHQFDSAANPYAARNALGITSTGGGGAPTNAQYITAATDPTLSNERVLTDTASVTWDFSTPGQAKATATGGGGGGGGNVSNSGTPVLGQYAKWVTSTTIQGVSPATVLSDIGAQPAGSYLTTAAAAATYQPLDGDLTAIAALTGTNTIYYRSAANTWAAVTIGTGLSFTGGTLAGALFGTSVAGDVPASGGGTANFLRADGTWAAPPAGGGGTPGGSNTQVQFNDGGAFGGDADLIWNKTTNVMTLTGGLTIVAGAATSITADGVVKASSFQTFGTNAVLGPVTAGNVSLRPNGIASATNQFLIGTTGVTTNNPVLLPADPTLALQAATKQYVDSKVGAATGLLAVQVFATAGSTTYTPTPGMVNCLMEVCAAGGGGGGVGAAAVNYYAGSGGGSGAYSRAFKTAAQVGASINVTVGAKGTGASNANGTAGGDSFVGANLAASLCGAKGGAGGLRTNSTVGAAVLGGAGGAAASGVGDLRASGNAGGPGSYISSPSFTMQLASGFGGASYFGGAATGVLWPTSSGATAGAAASAYGSGGSGAAGNDTGAAAGGAGSDGIVIITEYR